MKKSILCRLLIIGLFSAQLSACNKDDIEHTRNPKYDNKEVVLTKDSALAEFAKILSKATFHREDVRTFLRDQGALVLQSSDHEGTTLFSSLKDSTIADESLRDILVDYSSEEYVSAIESTVPRLRLFIPHLSESGISAKVMDCNNKHIPIAAITNDKSSLYVDGAIQADLPADSVPDFLFIAVTDGLSTHNFSPRAHTGLTAEQVGAKAVAAYSASHGECQRDNLYFDPAAPDIVKQNVHEYIGFIEIDPLCYSTTFFNNSEPHIIKSQSTFKGSEPTPTEFNATKWSQGSYHLIFKFLSPTADGVTTEKHLLLAPYDVWNFNYSVDYKHSTWFKDKSFTYSINPNRFTKKRLFVDPSIVELPSWHNSNKKPTHMRVDIYAASKEPGHQEERKHMGTVVIDYHDPIIQSQDGNLYDVKFYNTGNITLGICVK